MHFQSVALTGNRPQEKRPSHPNRTPERTWLEVGDTKAPLGDDYSSEFSKQFNKVSRFFVNRHKDFVAVEQILSYRHHFKPEKPKDRFAKTH